MARTIVPVLLAGVVGFGAVAAYLVAWDLFVTQSSCRGYEFDECTAGPIAMAVVGLPVLYAVWAVGLRATGARLAALAPLVLGLALFAAARAVGPYDTALVVWPTITGLLSALWRLRFGPEAPTRPLVSPGR